MSVSKATVKHSSTRYGTQNGNNNLSSNNATPVKTPLKHTNSVEPYLTTNFKPSPSSSSVTPPTAKITASVSANNVQRLVATSQATVNANFSVPKSPTKNSNDLVNGNKQNSISTASNPGNKAVPVIVVSGGELGNVNGAGSPEQKSSTGMPKSSSSSPSPTNATTNQDINKLQQQNNAAEKISIDQQKIMPTSTTITTNDSTTKKRILSSVDRTTPSSGFFSSHFKSIRASFQDLLPNSTNRHNNTNCVISRYATTNGALDNKQSVKRSPTEKSTDSGVSLADRSMNNNENATKNQQELEKELRRQRRFRRRSDCESFRELAQKMNSGSSPESSSNNNLYNNSPNNTTNNNHHATNDLASNVVNSVAVALVTSPSSSEVEKNRTSPGSSYLRKNLTVHQPPLMTTTDAPLISPSYPATKKSSTAASPRLTPSSKNSYFREALAVFNGSGANRNSTTSFLSATKNNVGGDISSRKLSAPAFGGNGVTTNGTMASPPTYAKVPLLPCRRKRYQILGGASKNYD
uniref:Uncharacterized protein n=1 Tax=Romanomermis culicivorax TaxID=13658 RepID=A0A915JW82_ROMCU